MDREGLASFLRARRDGIAPEDVGLTSTSRRRTPGLRREEVAALAGMSTDYYVRLEQSRGPRPSEQTLAALARALRLSNDERNYLYRAVGRGVPQAAATDGYVAPALQRVLDRLSDTPAMILSGLGETLVQNRMAVALLGDHQRFTGHARSSCYRWFTDPSERAMYPPDDWERQGRSQVANLRVSYSTYGPQSRAGALVRELLRASSEFRKNWDLHEVAIRFEDHKVLLHPELGPLELDCQTLFTEDQSQTLLVLTTAPRTEAADKLALLGVIGQQNFTR